MVLIPGTFGEDVRPVNAPLIKPGPGTGAWLIDIGVSRSRRRRPSTNRIAVALVIPDQVISSQFILIWFPRLSRCSVPPAIFAGGIATGQ